MRERLRVSLEKNSTLEEELHLTKEEVSVLGWAHLVFMKYLIEYFLVQLQQIRSGAIHLSNQNDGTKSSDGNKVSHDRRKIPRHLNIRIH